MAAAFIWVNSISGLIGVLSTGAKLPSELPIWLGLVLVGGFIGATYSSKYMTDPRLNQLLSLVLLLAGLKMLVKF